MNQIFNLKDAINILKELRLCSRDINSVEFDITGCSKEDEKLVELNIKRINEILSGLDLDELEIVTDAKVINLRRLKEAAEKQLNVDKERKEKVLNMDYVSWLVEFVKKEKSFNTEAENIAFNESWSETDKENVLLIDTLFGLIVEYYEDNGLPIEEKDAKFFNQTVTVNLTLNLSIELTLWCGQGSLIEVKIIQNTDKVLIEDVILHFRLN